MWPFNNKKKAKYVLKRGDYSFQNGVDQLLHMLSETMDLPLIIESYNLENNNCHYPLEAYVQYESGSTLYTIRNSRIEGDESIPTLVQNFDLSHLYFSAAFDKIPDSYALEKFVTFRNLEYYSEVHCRIDLAHEYIGLEFAAEKQKGLLEVLENLSRLMQIERI